MNTCSHTASTTASSAISGKLMDMPTEQLCPCGGGQSCIVDRRWIGDWVHEDDVFTNAGLPLRKNCFTSFTAAQKKLLY